MGAENEGPVLTQRMKIHLNGGSKWSQLTYDILADDEPTGITMTTVTDGSPDYLITSKVLCHGEDTFDLMAGEGDPIAWIHERIAKPESEVPS